MANDEEIERFQARLKQGAGFQLAPGAGFVRWSGLRNVAWIAGAAGLALLGWKGPAWMIERGRESSRACFEEKVASASPVGDECRATAWLAAPKAFAWTRDRARDEARHIERRAAEHDLAWAARAVAKPDEVDRAAAKLQAVTAKDPPRRDFDALAYELSRAGAAGPLARLDPARTAAAFRARLWLGDVEGATKAALVRPEIGSDDVDLRRAAFLCLVGRREDARAAVRARVVSSSWDTKRARRVLALCGDAAAQATQDPKEWNAIALSDPKWEPGRRAAAAHEAAEASLPTTVTAGLCVAEDAAMTPADVVELLVKYQRQYVADGGLLPSRGAIYAEAWDAERFHASAFDDDWFASGELLERAADRLEKWAAEGLDLTKDLTARTALDDVQRHAKSWPALFRRTAWVLRFEASASYARVGDMKRSTDAAKAAAKAAPEKLAWLVARRLVARGEPEEARRLCSEAEGAAWFGELPAGDRGFVRVTKALAYAKLRRWKDAADAAARADAPSWLRFALDLQAGADNPHRAPWNTPLTPEPKEEPYAWAALARASEADRRSLRLKLQPPAIAPSATAPAMLFLVGKASPPGGDVDLWLDAGVFASSLGPTNTRALLRARAEAARWAGDEARAGGLEQRAASLDRLVVDVKAALLAEIADL